jgi:cysteinyl-tRNA synthetase
MNDDFNTPGALAVLFELASDANRTRDGALSAQIKQLAATLGFLQQAPQVWLQSGVMLSQATIEARIAARAQAKRERNFAEADRIRDELLAQGVVLKDSAQGTTWVKA